MKLKQIVMTAVIITATTTAHASEGIELANRLGIGVSGGFAFPMQSNLFKNNTEHGWSAGGSLYYFFSNAFGLNLAYDHVDFSTGGRTIGQSYSGGFLWRVVPTSWVTPVLQANLGYGETRNSDITVFNHKGLTANGKVGLDFALSQCLLFGLSAKYIWFNSTDNSNFDVGGILPQASLTLFFGGGSDRAEAGPVVIPPSATPRPPVGDSDHDGVPDDVDQCPNTPEGAKVNSIGCTVEDKVEMTIDIQFDNGKSVIKEEYRDEIAKMGKLMQEHPDLKAEIQGHTDMVGDAKKNQKLSEARAKAVKGYLIDQFEIDPRRLSSKGYGSSKPVADNKTAEGRGEEPSRGRIVRVTRIQTLFIRKKRLQMLFGGVFLWIKDLSWQHCL